MRYVVLARFASLLATRQLQWRLWAPLRLVWWLLAGAILVLAYIGVFLSVTGMIVIVLPIFSAPGEAPNALPLSLIGVLVLVLAVREARFVRTQLRRGIIDVELCLFLSGTVFALVILCDMWSRGVQYFLT